MYVYTFITLPWSSLGNPQLVVVTICIVNTSALISGPMIFLIALSHCKDIYNSIYKYYILIYEKK